MKILTVFGTRPEVIKLAPFIKAVENDANCISITCATTQHRELQNDILSLFNIHADYDLDIMKEQQDLFHITEGILHRLKTVIDKEQPDFTVVQGDTTTAFAAALSSFYRQIPVVHIEAGLRTGNIHSPFPEEANRTLISRIASLHMAPTQKAVHDLEKEGVIQKVHQVGNTIVDAVHWILKNCLPQSPLIKEIVELPSKKILITVHRRENFGAPLEEICRAIVDLCHMYPKYVFIWPVHPNPNICEFVHQTLKDIPNLRLLKPLSYSDLIFVLNTCALILSDSGGIQEEACILGKRIIVLRNETERPEVIEAGYGVLAGANRNKIVSFASEFIKSSPSTVNPNNIYGKPGVSEEILKLIKGFI